MKQQLRKLSALLSTPCRRLAVCYAAFTLATALVFLARGLYREALFGAGAVRETQLTVGDFTLVDAEQLDEMSLVNASGDTQMHYAQSDILNLYADCTFSMDPGEFVLFYETDADADFGVQKMLYAKWVDGSYVFELPFGVKKIRLDTGTESSITVRFRSITLNRHTAADCFRFRPSALLWLLVVPGIVCGVCETLWDAAAPLCKAWLARRRKKQSAASR